MWVEFELPADAVLHDVLGPLLAEARTRGLADGGLALRHAHRVTVQLAASRAHPGSPVAAELGTVVGADLRAATEVPLAGGGFGGAALAETTRGFLARVTPGLLELASGAAPLPGALDLMTAHLAAVSARDVSGIPLGFLTYRSHAEAFFASSRDPARARAALDSRYAQNATAVRERVAAILDGSAALNRPAEEWVAAVAATKSGMAADFAAGGLTVPPASDGDGLAASAFHRAVSASPDLRRFLGADPGFLAVRLLTSLLYLSLHTIGMTLLERYFLCHAIACACESLSGVDSAELVSRLG